ncbi:protein yecM [Klebsiella pneumoniae]|nr:protein yecM [Klebsiella pneumoniae]
MANWQQNEQLADITADLSRFSDALERFTARLGLEIAGLDADHISLRCHQNTTAERWRRGLEQCGTLLSENMINGRPICLFKLAEPVCVAHWRFHIVELPWPGEKRYPHEGWEHIEIVLPGDPATLNARALALLADDGLSQPGSWSKPARRKGSMSACRTPPWR